MAKKVMSNGSSVTGYGVVDLKIETLILDVNGIPVLLDRDLAELYNVETKAINQAVKRNKRRFPERFCFQIDDITKNELVTNCDRFQMLKHSSAMPYAFTEQGVAMLSSVLHSEQAILVNIAIMDAFVEMRRHFYFNGVLNDRFDFIERKQMVFEQETLKRFDSVFKTLDDIKNKPDLLKHFLILNGQKFEADVAHTQIYSMAKESVIVIDNYLGVKTLDLLRCVAPDVKVTILSDQYAGCRLTPQIVADFQAARPDVVFDPRPAQGMFHDRYVVVDFDTANERMFHCGASSKDAGGKITTIMEIEDIDVYRSVLRGLLSSKTF